MAMRRGCEQMTLERKTVLLGIEEMGSHLDGLEAGT